MHFPDELQSEEKFHSRDSQAKNSSDFEVELAEVEEDYFSKETGDFRISKSNNRYQTRESFHETNIQSNSNYIVQKGKIGNPRESQEIQNLREKEFGQIFAFENNLNLEEEKEGFFSENNYDLMEKLPTLNSQSNKHQITLNENGDATFKLATQQSENNFYSFSPKPLISQGKAFRTEG